MYIGSWAMPRRSGMSLSFLSPIILPPCFNMLDIVVERIEIEIGVLSIHKLLFTREERTYTGNTIWLITSRLVSHMYYVMLQHPPFCKRNKPLGFER